MLKILMIISEAPPIASGVARVASQLQAGIEAQGHHVDIISLADVPRFVRGEVRVSSMLWRAPRLLLPRLKQYDVVHIHGPVPTFSDVALLFSALRAGQAGPGVVYTHHAEIDLRQRGYQRLCAIYNWTHKQMARLAHQVIVSTPAYADDLGRFVPEDRLTVVPWGVDSGWYSEDVARAERFTVLFVGQLRPYKGVDTLLRTAARIKDIDFQIIGGGFQEPYYRGLASRLRLDNVTFRGRVSDDELFEAYAKSHVLVLPSTSRQEAFGLVLLEGMVAGCVPVVSQLPGITDTVGDAGLSFPVGDAAALASLLMKLRDDPVLRSVYSRRAQERARQYTWQRTVREHKAIYDRLTVLRRFDKALQSEEKDEGALHILLQDTMATLGASAGSIMLLEPERQMLHLRAASGLPRGVRHRGQPLGQGIAGFVASRRVPLMLPEAFESDMAGELATYHRRSHIHSALSVPLHTEEQTLGVMNLSSHVHDRHFKEDDLEWLSGLARQAADTLLKVSLS
jgi:glycosyltransferase involved in cell wall biosynthesis/putative methionine-R-sulfoxide reductase with GAF domain